MADFSPITEHERIASLDALRGLAVLGILAMNITAFALPMAAYVNPVSPALAPYAGEFRGGNFAAWLTTHLVFDQKMITIFSALFGAGLVVMDRRSGGRFLGVHSRRMLWLLFLGLAHAYLVWFGDILVTYALCGALIYPLRRLRPRTLIVFGLLLCAVTMAISTLMGLGLGMGREAAMQAEAVIAAGGEPTEEQAEAIKGWRDACADLDPTPEQVAEQVAAFRGSYPETVAANVKAAVGFQTFYLLIWGLWRTTGVMMIGMALMKLGVFSASLPGRRYAIMVAAGYGLGLPVVAAGAWDQVASGFDPVRAFVFGWHFNAVGSLLVALGHVGAVMWVCRAGVLPRVTRRLAAVGRMALTNYLAQSVICTAVFFGWGFGLFGSLERWQIMLAVLGVWLVELAWSPWWLARFRFGPAEWVWRSLTYWRFQAMRRSAPPAPAAA